MAILIKSSGEELEVIPKNQKFFNLEELQEFVHGYIEFVKLGNAITMVVNEEGKLNRLPFNLTATELLHSVYGPWDSIVGDVLVARNDELDDEQEAA
jgi:hypothetical protein